MVITGNVTHLSIGMIQVARRPDRSTPALCLEVPWESCPSSLPCPRSLQGGGENSTKVLGILVGYLWIFTNSKWVGLPIVNGCKWEYWIFTNGDTLRCGGL